MSQHATSSSPLQPSDESLYHLGYVSTEAAPFSQIDLVELLAVARNALGIIGRNDRISPPVGLFEECDRLLDGTRSLETPGLLAELRKAALEKLTVDAPKYASLVVARAKWTGDD